MDLSVDGGETFLSVDLGTVSSDEAIALEDAFGITWLAFLKGIGEGSARAQKAVVWLAMRRDRPDLSPADVKYDIANFTVREDETVPLSEGSATPKRSTRSSSRNSSLSDPGNGEN